MFFSVCRVVAFKLIDVYFIQGLKHKNKNTFQEEKKTFYFISGNLKIENSIFITFYEEQFQKWMHILPR